MGLFSEIKRRNVHRMAVLYVVVAWLIMQVTDVLKELASLPDWVGPVVLGLLATGFPIALILSWIYEITPEGIELDKDAKSEGSAARQGGRRLNIVVISLLCAAVLMFAYDKWWSSDLAVDSVAVLPINAISADPVLGYMADGMTELLISELGRIGGLRVISRTSTSQYKTTDKKLPEIARELVVDALLEGSIQRFDDKLRVGVHLVDGRTDRQLWSGSFDREVGDLMALQAEVARAIASELNFALTPEVEAHLTRDRKTAPEAIRYWAIGHHHLRGLTSVDYQKAINAFNQALEWDPEMALAYVGIAQVHLLRGSWFGKSKPGQVLPLARSAADKAIQLDPELADAHFLLGSIHVMDWDWESAERAFRNGAKLNPNDSMGLIEFANFLTAMGRAGEAVKIAEEAVKLDPLSPVPYNELGWALRADGRVNAALAQHQAALQLDAQYLQTQLLLARLYISTGEIEMALPMLEQMRAAISPQSWTIRGLLGLLYGQVDRQDVASEILESLTSAAQSAPVPAMAFVYPSIGLERYDAALDWLELAYEEHDQSLMYLRDISAFSALFDSPRYQELVARMHFPGKRQ